MPICGLNSVPCCCNHTSLSQSRRAAPGWADLAPNSAHRQLSLTYSVFFLHCCELFVTINQRRLGHRRPKRRKSHGDQATSGGPVQWSWWPCPMSQPCVLECVPALACSYKLAAKLPDAARDSEHWCGMCACPFPFSPSRSRSHRIRSVCRSCPTTLLIKRPSPARKEHPYGGQQFSDPFSHSPHVFIHGAPCRCSSCRTSW